MTPRPLPPPRIPLETRPNNMSPAPPAPPPPSKPLPGPSSNRPIGPPLLHFHPSYFYDLRYNGLSGGAKAMSLLWPQVKAIWNDPTVHSVTFSKKFGPGGRNAFLSYAPHFHPNPQQLAEYLKQHPGATSDEWEDKVVWERRDADRNTDTGNATQANQLSDVCQKVFILTLAYHLGTKFNPSVCQRCLEQCYKLLWTFFGDPETRMLPEIEYGQYVRGCQPKPQFRPEGLLHVRSLIQLSQVLPLLPAPPDKLSPHHFMHPWFEQHVSFLQNHEVGRSAAHRQNNIQTHYFIQLATHLITLNRPSEAHDVATQIFFPSPTNPRGISSKVSPETNILVHELKRPNPLHYHLFELEPLIFLASLADSVRKYNNNLQHLPDVWEAENHALKRAHDFTLKYLMRSYNLDPRNNDGSPWNLPPGTKEPERGGTEFRQILFHTRGVAEKYGTRIGNHR
ncbi:hypothetical protein T439DRAFT_381585 [Meredithblackwellia eburnea MCA 4105]